MHEQMTALLDHVAEVGDLRSVGTFTGEQLTITGTDADGSPTSSTPCRAVACRSLHVERSDAPSATG